MQAYIYIRFSTPKQEHGSSRERQLSDCRAFIARMGWTEAGVVEDLGRSAWKGVHLKSGNLGKLATEIHAGELPPNSVLVVEELDRLSRQTARITQRWIEDVCDAGVSIATVKGERSFNATNLNGNLLTIMEILLKAQAAHDYVEMLSKRVKRSYDDRVAKAREDNTAITTNCPAWLRVVGTKGNLHFQPIPERVQIVREIHDLCVAGQSPWAIAIRLNARGEPSFGGKAWERTAVIKILRNRAVEGDRVVGEGKASKPTGEVLVGYYGAAILPTNLIAEARAMMDRRRRGKGRNSGSVTNLFGSSIRCGECGGPMRLTGYQSRYLTCYEAARANGCNHRTTYRYRPFEAAALDKVLHFALDERFFRQAAKSNDLSQEIAALEKALRDKTAEADRAYGMWDRTQSPAAERRLMECEAEGKRLTEKLAALNAKLEQAKGSASAEAHLKRVHAVREALTHEDEEVRLPARLRVLEALAGVVDYVRAGCDAEGRRSLLVIMVGGAHSVRFDNAGNTLWEMKPSAEFPTNAYADARGNSRLNTYLKRREAKAA